MLAVGNTRYSLLALFDGLYAGQVAARAEPLSESNASASALRRNDGICFMTLTPLARWGVGGVVDGARPG